MVGKTLGDVLKRPKKLLFKVTKATKKDIIGAKNGDVVLLGVNILFF